MISDYRHRVVLERLGTPVQNTFGEPVETWEEYAVRWAGVEPLEGREYLQAQQTQTAVDHRIRLRYDTETALITPAMRIRYGARLFDIQSVIDPEERHVELPLMARVRA